jgi:hypothetical protein
VNPRHRRRRWLRWALAWCLAVSAFFVIALGLSSRGARPQALPPTTLPVPPWDSPSATAVPPPAQPAAREPASPALTGPVPVIPGTQVVNGVSLGWPHTTAGAVSAADELAAQVLSTLDPGRAAVVMRLAADPSYPGGPQQAARGIEDERRLLGLPATGPVPPGYSFTVSPQGYQLPNATANQATVLLLCDFTSATPGQAAVTMTGVFPVAVHWAQGDWKALPTPGGDYSGLVAQPGTAQAASLGWQLLIAPGSPS